ncbi:MAG: hypothetical protein KF838_12085 [Phycisphaeraceae bacterium]|nr:MAG: hypothetical protein KF838_12085 [Phycisphaeraceae bacterium]
MCGSARLRNESATARSAKESFGTAVRVFDADKSKSAHTFARLTESGGPKNNRTL